MNANELTFGIEIEATCPVGTCPVGGYHNGIQVPFLPAGWNAQRDRSIRARHGREGVEIVSPVLKGADGLRQVLLVVAELNRRGFTVNGSTGFHVHVGGFDRDEQTINRMTTLVANFEKAIYASTGTKSRERGHYCGSIQRHGSSGVAINAAQVNRYHVLNLARLRTVGTVEFRAFAGTLNAVKITGYIRLCLGLVERATEAARVTNWTAKPVKESSPIARSGEGQTALTRLFYQLGWIKGRQKKVFGDVSTDSSPDVKAVKKELMRMARKYDQSR